MNTADQVELTVPVTVVDRVDRDALGAIAEVFAEPGGDAPSVLVAAGLGDDVGVRADGRALPVPPVAIAQALAYVEGTAAIEPIADSAALADRLDRAGGSPAVTEWLTLVCRAAATADAATGLVVSDTDVADVAGPPSTVEVLVDRAFLRAVTSVPGAEGTLRWIRQSLWDELGVPLPSIQLHRAPWLRPNGLAVRVAGLQLPSRVGLAQDTVLVNATVEQMKQRQVVAAAAVNPETHLPAAIVPAAAGPGLESAGWTTWSPLGHLTLSVADAVRHHACRFVTPGMVRNVLEQFGRAWPELCSAVDSELPRGAVVVVLHELARERVCLRNMRLILELMLRCNTDGVPPEGWLERVRAGLAEQIAHQLSRGAPTLAVYLVDRKLERTVVDGDAAAMRTALGTELAKLPPTVRSPPLLVDDRYRTAVRDAVLGAFPWTSVLGFRDLPAALNVQPVARLSAR